MEWERLLGVAEKVSPAEADVNFAAEGTGGDTKSGAENDDDETDSSIYAGAVDTVGDAIDPDCGAL